MIRAVLFDLDRTLPDRDSSIQAFAESQFEKFQTRLGDTAGEEFTETFIRLDARGLKWKDEVYQALVQELSLAQLSWEELYADFLSRITDFYRPFPGLHEMLTDLGTRYTLGLITNGRTEFQKKTIATLGIEHHFRAILISEEEGVKKPDAEIFQRALHRLGVQPAKALYVGDHPVSDMQGASGAGLWTIWKRNSDFPGVTSDAVIDELGELAGVVEALNKHQWSPRQRGLP